MTGPGPAASVIRNAVRAGITDLAPGKRVFVACSGGADSLALASATAFIARSRGLFAGAIIIDHDLQEGSAKVAAEAAKTCRALGLDPVMVTRVLVGGTGGLEAAARAARYEAFDSVAEEYEADAILLGHTMEDQAETVLLALTRGAGTRSLAGMPARRGRYRRPLLSVRREQTRQACHDQGLSWWEDPTNDVTSGVPVGLRARVRGELLPHLEEVLGQGVIPSLARTATLLREDSIVLDREAELAFARTMISPGRYSCQGLGQLPAAVRRRVLRTAILGAGGPPGQVGYSHVLAVDALIVDYHGQGSIDLPGTVVASRRGEVLRIEHLK